MIWLWLYIASLFVTSAVSYHLLSNDRYTAKELVPFASMALGIFNPLVVAFVVVIVPARILSLRLGPYIDNIVALTKEGK